MDSFDISRVGFDPLKHYSGVRMQQGRVATDDDYNEDNRIADEQQRRDNIHIIGSSGSPDDGFRIRNLSHAGGIIDFDISPGSIYVGGLQFEMEAGKSLRKTNHESYRRQRDWLQGTGNKEYMPEFKQDLDRYDLVYLECWQQAVSAVEDSELLETALGGPDTGVRIRNMRRVKIKPDIGEADCARAWQKQVRSWKDNHMGSLNQENELIRDLHLQVTFLNEPNTDNLCSPSTAGGYLGAENQAIRVQLTNRNKFTWGFDNASPLYRVLVNQNTISFQSAIKDQQHWPLSGQVVEILPWSAILPNGEKVAEITGVFGKARTSYNPDAYLVPDSFEVNWFTDSGSFELDQQNPCEYYFLRVWNRGTDHTDPEIEFVTGTPVPLGNTGLAVTFSGDDRICGDFWVIAARPNTSNKVVPWKLEVSASPNGMRMFYAPLAILQWHDYGGKIVGQILHDCRKTFRPLTDQKICCTYTVGDKIHSRGDFSSIEQAVENLSPDGGRICVLPGDHFANLQVFEKSNIQITGCGGSSVVRPHPEQVARPIFHFDACQNIELSNLSLVAAEGTAIHIVDRLNVPTASSGVLIRDNQILALKHAVTIRVKEDSPGDNDIRIVNNRIGMVDKEGGFSAIFCIGDDVLIEGNRIVVVSQPDRENPEDPRKPDDPGYTLYNPCLERNSFYKSDFRIQRFIHGIFLYINGLTIPEYRIRYKALGGIQIGSTSERVGIVNNDIIGGAGNGITLGHLPEDIKEDETDADKKGSAKRILERRLTNLTSSISEKENFEVNFRSSLYDITIERNRIRHMGLSGIGVVSFFNMDRIGLMICLTDVIIYRNSILKCAQQIPEEIPAKMQEEAAYGGIVLASCDNCSIRVNHIENNGINNTDPVCGIYIMMGDRLEIADNHILNNGPRIENTRLAIRKGIRGGIVIRMSLKKYESFTSQNLDLSSFDGMPAVSIQGNIVTQPLGHALFLVALGPVCITGNIFTTQGIDKTNSCAILAGTIFVLNLGVSKDFLFNIVKSFRQLVQRKYTDRLEESSIREVAANLSKLQYLPSGNVMFSNNQTTLDLRDPSIEFTLSSQMLATLDDIGYHGNQSDCTSFMNLLENTTDMVLLNTFLAGITVRSNDNRFQEGTTYAWFSLLSFGIANMAIGNQSTHCLLVYGIKRPDPLILLGTNTVFLPLKCEGFYKQIDEKMIMEKKIDTVPITGIVIPKNRIVD